MKKTLTYTLLASTMALMLGVAATASAETSVSASTTVRVDGPRGILKNILEEKKENRSEEREEREGGRPMLGANASTTLRMKAERENASTSPETMAKAKERALKELDKRSQSLTELSARIDGMKKLSDSQKATIKTELQAEIAKLAALKVKITADTDPTILRTDIQSITSSYRIYALIMPQIAVLVAADKAQNLIDDFTTVIAKLQARIDTARTAGKDVSALVSALADINAKIADAKVQVSAAVSGVASLTADNGDKTKAEANTAALKAAKDKLKAASTDLKQAKTSVQTITKGTKGFGEKGEKGEKRHASSTASVTASSTTDTH